MMRKSAYMLLVLMIIFSCKEQPVQAQEKETTVKTTTKKEEKMDPRETEVWEPEPKVVTFNENNIPSDAIVLFDGTNLDAWVATKDSTSAAGWTVNPDKTMTIVPGTGDIQTRQHFGSVQLHLEWSAPDVVEGKGQGRGNSGVFFYKEYEVQILDSYQNRTYSNGQAASVYKQHIPLVNATKAPDEWQTYDIIFHAPEFDTEGKKTKSGTFTVIHNGVLVQDHIEILGTTRYRGHPKNIPHGKGPIKLQDHSNPIQFRNIWVREL